jgi:enamine deaminase RidA (YjgF/YER057c/UK114 family)
MSDERFRVVELGRMISVAGEGAHTKEVLERIDRLLARAGIDKSKLLTAQVRLADLGRYEEHNAAWTEWVDVANPPLRTCVQAAFGRPETRVEITVTATK